ncbi:MAG: DNA-processing protein DprA [Verrucomicrobiae bacterium]|nr:DNA-processing protein DprA [Verrucomicrobiae bacterium]
MRDFLTEDTKAINLLCGVFSKDCSEKPLSLKEYSSLVRWLIQMKMRPSDLLEKDNIHQASIGSGIDRKRLESLLGRGVQLGFAVEEWQRNGIWIISRSDSDYPARYKKHLKDKAPPLLFGIGNRSLLKGGGLSIVGSRDVDQAGVAFTRKVAELCAYNRMPVISGGAKGVDQIAMTTAVEAGGVAIGVLADNLLRRSLERSARQAIADGRLLLMSPYHPNARFTVGAAMGRNKLIYAMSEYGLVVSAEHEKGGTWTGAEEELRRENSLPVFVRTGDDVPQGNIKLLDLGAISWPNSPDRNNLKEQLESLSINRTKSQPQKNLSLFDLQPEPKIDISEELLPTTETKCPASIYEAVLPIILDKLDTPATAEELAKKLEVNKTQLNDWLKKAVEEKKIAKLSKPVRYRKTETGAP